MDLLWSASTTMRNPERTYSFLKTIKEVEGMPWNDETQMRLQSLLIKNRFYKPTKENLSQHQIDILEDLNYQMSYTEARDIFDSKKYTDAPMRGRTTFDPIEKLGLASLEIDSKTHEVRVRTTELGQLFLDNRIALEDVVFSNLLKFQYPNPLSSDCRDYNTKPFINTLRLIKKVNELCNERGLKAKGVSKDEFGIFVLSIKSYDEIEEKAESLLTYRKRMSELSTDEEKQNYRTIFVEHYLSNFKEPVKNTKEYADNIIRYVRLTKYIYIRGGGYYIDLEPRRMIEIESLLEMDNGSAKSFSLEEYKAFIGDYYSYTLPFETIEKLTKIAEDIVAEINALERKLSLSTSAVVIANNITDLKTQIESLRERRISLQNLILKANYQQIDQIDSAINALKNIRKLNMKPSVALEKWTNIALNIINDALLIKPNSPLGDDNEPIFTAPAGVPDIECFYDGFGAICEVTMLTGRDQWFNEGQPVMRHLRDFENQNRSMQNYCLFVAPSLHQDTMNTFWNAVKYEYQGSKQKIVPITIAQLIDILQGIKNAKVNHRKVTKDDMKTLYESCTQLNSISDSTQWSSFVTKQIVSWKERVTA
ncbi:MAG TPA: AlwI family type II restriction endonuclease [Candidatus Scatosoma pullicola]|nr:AlwI family type II restriction endonuclease [Candidatus Scatosoma pullicola]